MNRELSDMPSNSHEDPLVYWWRRKPNFGDALNPLLLSSLSGLSLKWSNRADTPVLACVGSIIAHAKPMWTIWGSGCIAKDFPIPEGLKIVAVRGPRTRKELMHHGYDVPPVFGDPGLLMPLVCPFQDVEAVYDWGIIPHAVHFRHRSILRLRMRQLASKTFGRPCQESVCLIDPRKSIDTYMHQVAKCRTIVSSSLHGLIIGEALGKPTVWITFRGDHKVLGGEFKFRDFFEGIGKTNVDPVVVGSRLDYSAFDQVARSWQPMSWDPVPLMNAFPYQTQLWKENTSKAAAYFAAAPF